MTLIEAPLPCSPMIDILENSSATYEYYYSVATQQTLTGNPQDKCWENLEFIYILDFY